MALVSHLGPNIIRPCQKNLLFPGQISNSLILVSSDLVDDGSIRVMFPYGVSGDSIAFACMSISAICLIFNYKAIYKRSVVILILKLNLKIYFMLINCEYVLLSLHGERVLGTHIISSTHGRKLMSWGETRNKFRGFRDFLCRNIRFLGAICILRSGFKAHWINSY